MASLMDRKRPRSSSPAPPRRYVRRPPPAEAGPSRAKRTMADIADNQEVFLRVLAFLDARDLVSVQGVSRYWAMMSLDPQVSGDAIV
jgi:hypothetical protein